MAFSLLLVLWILPGLVMAVTPIGYRDVIGLSRDALVTAFATSSEFVVLPILAMRGKELLRRHQLERPESDSLIDIVIPVSFNFPHVAKILSLSFVVFAGWFSGVQIEGSEWVRLAFAGIASSFASVNLAIPFLLELFRIPEDMFQLFIATSVLNSHFGALLAAMHVLVLALLVTCARTGVLTFRWKRIVGFLLGTAILSAGVIGGGRYVFERDLDTTYLQGELIGTMQLAGATAPSVIHENLLPALTFEETRQFRIDLIRERGTIRVGFRPEGIPFSFYNRSGDLVGFDVAMAHSLARGLGVSIDFVAIRRAQAPQLLEKGVVDVVMAGVPIALELSRFVDYSDSYMDLHLAFLVEDYRRDEFRDLESLRERPGLRIAALDDPYSLRSAENLLPGVTIVPVSNPRAFLEGREGPADAMVYAAEIASAWSLLYPQFAVAVPEGTLPSLPLAYMLPRGEPELLHFTKMLRTLSEGELSEQ